MTTKFNPLVKKGFDKTGMSQAEADAAFLKLDQTTPQTIIGSNHIPVGSEPSNPINGSVYINSSDNKMYVYYSSTWQELHELVAATPETGQPMGLWLPFYRTYQL